MKKFHRLSLLTSLCFLLCTVIAAGQNSDIRQTTAADGAITARAEMSPKSPHLADTIAMKIVVEHTPDYSIETPVFGDRYGEFSINAFETPQPSIQNNRETTVFELRLHPEKSGKLALPPIPMKARRSGLNLNTNESAESTESPSAKKESETKSQEAEISFLIPAGTIAIQSDFADREVTTADLSQPAGIFHRFPILSLCLGVLATAIIIGLILLTRRHKQKEKEMAAIRTPLEIATERLDELMNSKIYETDVKEFYLRITAIVRWYLEKTTGVQAPEQTTEEFLREITVNTKRRNHFDTELRDRLQHFLEFSDLVKFAKFRPTLEDIFSGFKSARSVLDYRFQTLEPAEIALSSKGVRR